MDELPLTELPPSLVFTRWPPLAPKKESGCRRLSMKALSSGAAFFLALRER